MSSQPADLHRLPGITLLTRFSVRHHGQLPDEAWIEKRFALFRQITYPSVIQQTDPTFTWLIASAPEWEEKTRGLFQGLEAPPGMSIQVVGAPFQGDLPGRVHPEADTFITLRLDSDDALHRETIARVRALGSTLPDRSLINLCTGYRLNLADGRLRYTQFSASYQGPFLAVKHHSRPEMLDLGGNHRMAREHFDGIVTLSQPMWVQVVHGGNLRNTFMAHSMVSNLLTALGLHKRSIRWEREITDADRRREIYNDFGLAIDFDHDVHSIIESKW